MNLKALVTHFLTTNSKCDRGLCIRSPRRDAPTSFGTTAVIVAWCTGHGVSGVDDGWWWNEQGKAGALVEGEDEREEEIERSREAFKHGKRKISKSIRLEIFIYFSHVILGKLLRQ